MGALRYVGLVGGFQSNGQGATLTDNGGQGAKFTSRYTGETDPFRLNSNGGGSCWPLLVDLGLARGVKYIILNGGIGGAAIRFFPGTVGATVGGQTIPVSTLNTSGASLTGGTGEICREGDAGFDPFGLLIRMRTAKATYPQITEWAGLWSNAESDVGTSLSSYRDALVSIGDYFLDSGCVAYLPGLSASGGNNSGSMNTLSAGVDAAIALMQSQGKRVSRGADLYARFGMSPPLYPERTSPATKVHLTLEAQRVQAELWNAALMADGL